MERGHKSKVTSDRENWPRTLFFLSGQCLILILASSVTIPFNKPKSFCGFLREFSLNEKVFYVYFFLIFFVKKSSSRTFLRNIWVCLLFVLWKWIDKRERLAKDTSLFPWKILFEKFYLNMYSIFQIWKKIRFFLRTSGRILSLFNIL